MQPIFPLPPYHFYLEMLQNKLYVILNTKAVHSESFCRFYQLDSVQDVRLIQLAESF